MNSEQNKGTATLRKSRVIYTGLSVDRKLIKRNQCDPVYLRSLHSFLTFGEPMVLFCFYLEQQVGGKKCQNNYGLAVLVILFTELF